MCADKQARHGHLAVATAPVKATSLIFYFRQEGTISVRARRSLMPMAPISEKVRLVAVDQSELQRAA
jgi:hypothetical protein